MKNSWFAASAFLAVTIISTSCGRNPSGGGNSSDSDKRATPAVSVPTTLDIVVGGPFVFVEKVSCKSPGGYCLAIWAPKIKAHTTIVGIAAQAQYQQFDSGDYDFTTGLHGSMNTAVVSPVQGASIYQVPTRLQNATSSPAVKAFATLILPMPHQIVAWNADPMKISANGSAAPTTNVADNLATLTVLRYDYQDGDAPEVSNADGTFWKPVPVKSGSERIIIIGFVPPNVTGTQNAHKHAVEAFNAAAAMLGVKWNISISDPPTEFKRNRPLDPNGSLPQDLLNVIDQIPIETAGTKPRFGVAPTNGDLYGKINDCKAPAILVTN
jgi:hypothetical protein